MYSYNLNVNLRLQLTDSPHGDRNNGFLGSAGSADRQLFGDSGIARLYGASGNDTFVPDNALEPGVATVKWLNQDAQGQTIAQGLGWVVRKDADPSGLNTSFEPRSAYTLLGTSDSVGQRMVTEAGVSLSGGKAAGKRNTWVGQNNEIYTFTQTQAAQLGTLSISNLGKGNEVKSVCYRTYSVLANRYAGYHSICRMKRVNARGGAPGLALPRPQAPAKEALR